MSKVHFFIIDKKASYASLKGIQNNKRKHQDKTIPFYTRSGSVRWDNKLETLSSTKGYVCISSRQTPLS